LQENKSLQTQTVSKDNSLYTRDLIDVLKEPLVSSKDFVNTLYVQTLVLVVPKSNIQGLVENYESVSENIISGSLQQFHI
jgi:hypothetical protein